MHVSPDGSGEALAHRDFYFTLFANALQRFPLGYGGACQAAYSLVAQIAALA